MKLKLTWFNAHQVHLAPPCLLQLLHQRNH